MFLFDGVDDDPSTSGPTADDDTIRGGYGDDLIEVGGGSDSAHGGPGEDTLPGASGASDTLMGNGDDTIYTGEEGRFLSNSGTDTINGNAGDDLIVIDSAPDGATISPVTLQGVAPGTALNLTVEVSA